MGRRGSGRETRSRDRSRSPQRSRRDDSSRDRRRGSSRSAPRRSRSKKRTRKHDNGPLEVSALDEPTQGQIDVKLKLDVKRDTKAEKLTVLNVFEKTLENRKVDAPRVSFGVKAKVDVPKAAAVSASSSRSSPQMVGEVSGAVAQALANLQATAFCQVASKNEPAPSQPQAAPARGSTVSGKVKAKDGRKEPTAEELAMLFDEHEVKIPKSMEALYKPSSDTKPTSPPVVGLDGVGSLSGSGPTIVGDYYSMDAMTAEHIRQVQQKSHMQMADNLFGQKIHMCKFFLQGHCKNKVQCNYAHNEMEMVQARRLYEQRNGPTDFKRDSHNELELVKTARRIYDAQKALSLS
eukprot:gnl/MRDRNA2_/MRDRNA2_132331_c0_seq1.p1 gnl/MRDRNA2_/MRDRNA2_132331_c0~~gnl/MRDRNA2_/MRDRNA2_132331_c0_seq1.p1  ORF type:complete len:349 (-),score=67.59 gnl/MRDRNA2_/MRDRNA2_132331_c0_seq1:67-1113(-)